MLISRPLEPLKEKAMKVVRLNDAIDSGKGARRSPLHNVSVTNNKIISETKSSNKFIAII